MQEHLFPISEKTARFHRTHYSQVTDADWNNWKWQMRNRIRTLEELRKIFCLTPSEEEAIALRQGMLPLGLTPYYASLLDPDDASQGLRRTKIPSMKEFDRGPDEVLDPLGEEAHTPVPGIVHTYEDKVLFLVTDFCATYCRYCTRSRMVGGGERPPSRAMWEGALEYIRQTPGIRDVLLSGGDPLTLSDDRLEWLLQELKTIPHVEFIRIGTKVPVVLPQRITPELTRILRIAHPLYFSIHIIHPDELTPEMGEACNRLADAGIPLGGQTVLLKGVNDTVETMKALNLGMLRIRVKPYYLHQCDPVLGSGQFRTSVQTGLDILSGLHGRTTGYAIPHYMIDAPGGGGKVPIAPNYVHGREGEYLILRNYKGELYRYWDPA